MKNSGLTLVELLVVMGIVALISTLTIVNFQSTNQKARDHTRKSDLNNLAVALEAYYQKNARYIIVNKDCQNEVSADSNFHSEIASFMQRSIVPKDPSTNQNYCYQSSDGLSYNLFAKLENCADPEIINSQTCTSDRYNYLKTLRE